MEKQGITRERCITLLAERRSAPCCVVDSREVSSRQPVGEWRLAGKVSAVARFPRIGSLLPKDARFTYCSLVVCLLLVGSLLTGNYDSTQSLGVPLGKGKAEGLVLP